MHYLLLLNLFHCACVYFLKQTNHCFIFECILEMSLYGLKPLNFPHVYSKKWFNFKGIEEYCEGKAFLCAFSRIKSRQSHNNITSVCDPIISALAWLTRNNHLTNSHWSSYFLRSVTEAERPMKSQPTINPHVLNHMPLEFEKLNSFQF
jgi:hypothetical protein